jgi:hypothetical protein
MSSTAALVDGTKLAENASGSSSSMPVDEAIGRSLAWPHAGSPDPRMPAELPVRRTAVARFPDHVVYLEVEEQVRILAIAHDRRKPGYWKTRLK